MNREQNARAIDLEDVVDVTPESSGVEPDLPHAADAIGPGAIGEAIAETGGQVVGFVSRFHAAAEVQGRAHADLGARLDRLEDGQDVRDLQQMMRELHGTLTELVSETAKSIIRIEDRILSVTETVAALESSMESSNCAFRHLSVSAHEKIAGLDGQVNSTLQRVEQGEQSAAERIAGLDEQLNFVVQRAAKSEQSAAEKIDLLGNRFAEEQKETRALGEHLRQAERQIANFPQVEARVIALESNSSELKHFIEQLAQKHEVLRSHVIEEQAETGQIAEQLREAARQIARLPEVETSMRDTESHGAELRQLIQSLSQKHDFLRDKMASDQKETGELVEHLKLAGRHLSNFSNFETRVRNLESQEPELRQVEKSLREIQGLNEQISADVCTLGEGLRSLHGEVESVNVRHGHLKTRLEQAEIGLNDSIEQSQSLARLHARLAETYSTR